VALRRGGGVSGSLTLPGAAMVSSQTNSAAEDGSPR
jgi:hypothetical protein